MAAGQHGFPHAGGPRHPSEEAHRLGLALVLLAAAGYAWFRLTATGGAVLALLSWTPAGHDWARPFWELAPMALMMSLVVALLPAAAALGAAALGRLRHATAISGLALVGFTAVTLIVWLLGG